MSKHILAVDMIPTKNAEIFHLFDASEYSVALKVDCATLEITIPGYKDARMLTVEKHFNTAFNAKTLALIPLKSIDLVNLPDGIYHVKYSVSPNTLVYVEYDFMRTVLLDQKIEDLRCNIKLRACSPSEDTLEIIKLIDEIDSYKLGAIANVESCGELGIGIELLIYANQLLDKITNKYC